MIQVFQGEDEGRSIILPILKTLTTILLKIFSNSMLWSRELTFGREVSLASRKSLLLFPWKALHIWPSDKALKVCLHMLSRDLLRVWQLKCLQIPNWAGFSLQLLQLAGVKHRRLSAAPSQHPFLVEEVVVGFLHPRSVGWEIWSKKP